MKLIAILFGAALSVAPSLVIAQTASPAPTTGAPAEAGKGPGGPHPGGNPMEMLSNRLNLTEEQKTKIKPILDEGTEKIRAIHEETQAKIKAVKEDIHGKIKPLLNPDQQQKLEQLKQEMENRPHPGGFGAGMPGRGFGKNAGESGPGMGGNLAEHLAKELNLTAEQQSQLKPIFEDTRAKIKAVWEDSSLSMEQKHAKGKEIREANRAKIEAVLTPEQKQKFESMRPQRGAGHEE